MPRVHMIFLCRPDNHRRRLADAEAEISRKKSILQAQRENHIMYVVFKSKATVMIEQYGRRVPFFFIQTSRVEVISTHSTQVAAN